MAIICCDGLGYWYEDGEDPDCLSPEERKRRESYADANQRRKQGLAGGFDEDAFAAHLEARAEGRW